MEKRIIKKDVTHQNIGGKEFIINDKVTETLSNDDIFVNATCGNLACKNFIDRRKDFNRDFPHKLYYGHVGNLGYVISEDEFE